MIGNLLVSAIGGIEAVRLWLRGLLFCQGGDRLPGKEWGSVHFSWPGCLLGPEQGTSRLETGMPR